MNRLSVSLAALCLGTVAWSSDAHAACDSVGSWQRDPTGFGPASVCTSGSLAGSVSVNSTNAWGTISANGSGGYVVIELRNLGYARRFSDHTEFRVYPSVWTGDYIVSGSWDGYYRAVCCTF